MCSNLSTCEINRASSRLAKEELNETHETFEQLFWGWFSKAGIPTFVADRCVYAFVETEYRHHRRYYVRYKASREEVAYVDVWKIGDATDDMPDNAEFIDRETYMGTKRVVPCNFKGCFDRYHCKFYDMANEVDGPWNEIPANWKVGDEKCESFIPKQES